MVLFRLVCAKKLKSDKGKGEILSKWRQAIYRTVIMELDLGGEVWAAHGQDFMASNKGQML